MLDDDIPGTLHAGKDYIYAVTPLLEDALMDRDLVHRQTAAVTVKHLALGCAGLGCEDAITHLMNYMVRRCRLNLGLHS